MTHSKNKCKKEKQKADFMHYTATLL